MRMLFAMLSLFIAAEGPSLALRAGSGAPLSVGSASAAKTRSSCGAVVDLITCQSAI